MSPWVWIAYCRAVTVSAEMIGDSVRTSVERPNRCQSSDHSDARPEAPGERIVGPRVGAGEEHERRNACRNERQRAYRKVANLHAETVSIGIRSGVYANRNPGQRPNMLGNPVTMADPGLTAM
jgi:hypothetical protein